MLNEHEIKHRAAKVLALSLALQKIGATAEIAREMSQHEWEMAAEFAKVKLPSEESQRQVIQALADSEAR